MSDKISVTYAIIKRLKSESSEGKLPEEKQEMCIKSIEVDYVIGASGHALDVDFTLQDMFQRYVSENGPTDKGSLRRYSCSMEATAKDTYTVSKTPQRNFFK